MTFKTRKCRTARPARRSAPFGFSSGCASAVRLRVRFERSDIQDRQRVQCRRQRQLRRVGVDLHRELDVAVAHQLLDTARVGAGVEEVGAERDAQGVQVDSAAVVFEIDALARSRRIVGIRGTRL